MASERLATRPLRRRSSRPVFLPASPFLVIWLAASCRRRAPSMRFGARSDAFVVRHEPAARARACVGGSKQSYWCTGTCSAVDTLAAPVVVAADAVGVRGLHAAAGSRTSRSRRRCAAADALSTAVLSVTGATPRAARADARCVRLDLPSGWRAAAARRSAARQRAAATIHRRAIDSSSASTSPARMFIACHVLRDRSTDRCRTWPASTGLITLRRSGRSSAASHRLTSYGRASFSPSAPTITRTFGRYGSGA